jgi:hypothetical protein
MFSAQVPKPGEFIVPLPIDKKKDDQNKFTAPHWEEISNFFFASLPIFV